MGDNDSPIILIHADANSLMDPNPYGLGGAGNGLIDHRSFRRAKSSQYMLDGLFITRRFHSDPQSRVFGCAQMILNVAQAVVPSMSASNSHAQLAERQIEIIAHDQ